MDFQILRLLVRVGQLLNYITIVAGAVPKASFLLIRTRALLYVLSRAQKLSEMALIVAHYPVEFIIYRSPWIV